MTARHPAGTPAGGKFAPGQRSDADVTLGAATHYEPTASLTEPAAYTYRADIYTPEGVVEQLIRERRASPAARDMAVEDVLDQIAGSEGIDRDDETLFDSDEFPKVVFGGDMDDGDTVVGVDGTHLTWGWPTDDEMDDMDDMDEATEIEPGVWVKQIAPGMWGAAGSADGEFVASPVADADRTPQAAADAYNFYHR